MAGNRVVRAGRCELRAEAGTWEFARAMSGAVDAHWERRRAESPGFFNGTVFILSDAVETPGAFSGRLIAAEFKSFLYWKEHGYPDASVRDCFGSGLIRSAEGHVLLGRQRPGNINAGLAYLPGGFIDPRDVDGTGAIDITASIAREVAEETGLAPPEIERLPGYILTFAGPMLSIAVEFRARETAEFLARQIRTRIADDPHSELEDVVVVRAAADLDGLAMPIYAEVLMNALFA